VNGIVLEALRVRQVVSFGHWSPPVGQFFC